MKHLEREFKDWHNCLEEIALKESQNRIFSIKGIITNEYTSEIPVNPTITPYVIKITSAKKSNPAKTKDIALIGFNMDYQKIDCLQIQGRDGCYYELSNIPKWDKILFKIVADFGFTAGIPTMTLISAKNIPDLDPIHAERLIQRYDQTASHFKLKYSPDIEKYKGDTSNIFFRNHDLIKYGKNS